MQTRTLNGRYRLDEIIGEGGMAVVYRGYDLVLNRDVAVKLLREQYGSDENFLIRFDREAQAAARLSHPNVVNVYDVGQDASTRYIVMEFVNALNLKELLRRQGPFTAEAAAKVIRQIGDALDYAHGGGLVHRDIKPQNILIDGNGNAKVVDFGIAKGLSDATLTDAGTGMGTVHYVSPEQARGEPATPLSDVYSTGIVLYEMLTGELPFEADTPVGVAMKHVGESPQPPSELNSSLSPAVDDVVLSTLAKRPGDRYGSAGDLATALEQAIGGVSDASTRVMPGAAAAGAGAAVAGAAAARSGRGRGATPPGTRRRNGPPPRGGENFRDDVGCVTWLIGSAILIGLIGLVALAFRLGDFGIFDPNNATPSPTPTEVAEETPEDTETPVLTETPDATETPVETETPETRMARVPELLGATLEQARQSAQVGEFELVDQEVYDDTTEEGRIVSQDPSAGSELEVGSEIFVTVSRGPQFVSIPNLSGQSREQALSRLDTLPLEVSEVEEPSESVAEGNVIRTEPTDQARNGSTVTVVISMGDVVRVPDVYSEPLITAIERLENAGLVVNSAVPQGCEFLQTQNPSFDCDSFPDQGIVSATLQWNAWVPRGETIDLAYYEANDDTSDDEDTNDGNQNPGNTDDDPNDEQNSG